LVFINSKPIIGEYISTGEDYQSIKVLGKVLLNEYMVPFEFACTAVSSNDWNGFIVKKKKQRNNMNNILNEIGIENYIFLSTILFLYWGLWRIIQAKCNYRIYVYRNYAESQSFVCCIFYLSPRCTRTNFCLFSMAVAAAEVAVGLAILVSIFRNLGSIDINNLKKLKRINNEYKFSFTLISFIGFLFNVFFGKSIGKSASGIIGTLAVFLSFAYHLFSPNKSNLKNPNSI
jgi:NADH-quinone oxidoreductase subunit K